MAFPIQSLIQFLAISVSISAICSADLSKYNCILLMVKTVFVAGHSAATLWILLQGPLYFIKYTQLVLLVFTFNVFAKQSTHIYYWNARFPFQSASWFIISNTYVLSFTFGDTYLAATSWPLEFSSDSFNDTESRYSDLEKGLLSLVWALKRAEQIRREQSVIIRGPFSLLHIAPKGTMPPAGIAQKPTVRKRYAYLEGIT